jgi:ABC-type multidrug transport system fused ATPase/permease subunit
LWPKQYLIICQECYYPGIVAGRWLEIRLDTIANMVVLFTSLFAVLSRDSMDPSTIGLALSYALNITGMLNRFVTMLSEVETNMVSAERIIEYQKAPQEAPFSIPEQGNQKFYAIRGKHSLTHLFCTHCYCWKPRTKISSNG